MRIAGRNLYVTGAEVDRISEPKDDGDAMSKTALKGNLAGHECIFELAVYRVDYKTWERESAEQEKKFEELIPAWVYNDVVGWLRLSTSPGICAWASSSGGVS